MEKLDELFALLLRGAKFLKHLLVDIRRELWSLEPSPGHSHAVALRLFYRGLGISSFPAPGGVFQGVTGFFGSCTSFFSFPSPFSSSLILPFHFKETKLLQFGAQTYDQHMEMW